MRIALLADVHSNLEALQACLAHARRQGVDRVAFLGDLVGYGADPEAVLDIVSREVAAGAMAVKGNHDAAIAASDPALNDAARQAIDWTRARLCADHAAFLAGLPLVQHHDRCCFVHASADDPARWQYVTDDLAAARSLSADDCTWMFSGHVHDQVLYFQGAGRRLMAFAPVSGVWIPVGAHRRWLAIAGSCGQPRDGNPAAAYALFDLARARIAFHRVPYDNAAAAARIRSAGLPESLASRLERGA